MTVPYLAIVWHSRTGAARAMAQAAADAAAACEQAAPVQVRLLSADEATPDLMLGAAGYLFVCPENLGTMTGAMKEMFDRAYYPLLGQVAGRAQIDRIATGWRLRRVAEPLIICLAAQTPQAILAPKAVAEESLARCRELGTALAAGIALGMF
jgi:hypothetical protein